MKPHDPIDDLLKLPRSRPGGSDDAPAGGAGFPDACGDPELLAAYAEHALDDAAREQFQLHLADCASCRDAVVQLVRLAPRSGATVPVSVGWWASLSRGWRWGVPVAASLVLVGSIVLTRVDSRTTAYLPIGAPAATVAREKPLDSIAPAERTKTARAPVEPTVEPTAEPPTRTAAKLKAEVVAPAAAPAAAVADSARARADTVDAKDSPMSRTAAPAAAGSVAGGAPAKEEAAAVRDAQNDMAQAAAQNAEKKATVMARNFAAGEPVQMRAEAAVTCSIVKGTLSVIVGGGFPVEVKSPAGELTTCKFMDALTGDVRTKSGRDWHTKDGGKTWTLVPPPVPPKD